jgi:putative phosphoribosyl transferase
MVNNTMYFDDRREAGRQLAKKLIKYKNNPDALVLGLPRGGVVTAFEAANQLQLPLDIICARKVGAPHNPELAIGAVTETGEGYFNQELIDYLAVPPSYLKITTEKETAEAQRRLKAYRQNRPSLLLDGKIVILIDDGMATGATMKAAIHSVKSSGAMQVIVAVPVSSYDTFEEIKDIVDEAIAVQLPVPFYAVGEFYRDFSQTTDQEVIQLLSRSPHNTSGK